MNFLAVSEINLIVEFLLAISANHEHEAVIRAGDVISLFRLYSKSEQATLQEVIPGSNRISSEIVQIESGSFPKQKNFRFQIERTNGARFATSVEADSEEEAIALTFQMLKKDIVLIPTRQAAGDCRLISLSISYSIEIVEQHEPNEIISGKPFNKFTENQLQLHGQEFSGNYDASLHAWHVAIVKAFHLNPIEEAFVLDLPFKHPGDTPSKRIASVLAVRA